MGCAELAPPSASDMPAGNPPDAEAPARDTSVSEAPAWVTSVSATSAAPAARAAGRSPAHARLLALALLAVCALVACAVFSNTLGNAFVYDDINLVVEN